MTAPVVVFLGPTLSHDEARAVLDAEYRPPAAHGDVLRAALRRPRAIGLVDGVFERVPAVWHKEILFALSEGVHVYGAASMGALRAAELDAFGMRGVGNVYRAYADGLLEDDDEVAVAHAGAEHGFRALSDAMVDVRATLAAAVAAGVVGGATADLLLARVKSTFYAERALVAALDRGNEEHDRLRAWLPDGRVERKREDAFELLQAMRRDLDEGFERFRPAWTLQRTRYWEEARRSVELASGDDPGPTADAALDAVLDEARLDPDAYGRLADRSLLAALARSAAATAGVDVSPWAHEVARRGGAEGPRPARARRPGHVARRARSRPLRPARGRTTAGGAALGARRSSRRRRRRDGAGRPLRRRVRAALRPRGAQARRGRIAPVRSSDPR